MIPHITTAQPDGADGVQVFVRLSITHEEHTLIFKNRMAADSIELAHYQGRRLTFKDFYGGTHSTLWDIDSAYQAGLFINQLKQNFKQFEWFLEQNRKTPGVEPEPQPFNFFEADRFRHTWLVAPTGTGKTTYLSALIAEDLQKVAHGEASVLVVDSQNEHLSRYLPHLVDFAPGGELHGKLIYLEPDLHHPLALNIFDFTSYDRLDQNEQMEMLRTVEDMLMFFIGALIGELSGHMRNILSYALRALVLIPDATVFTFKDLLAKGGMAALVRKYPQLTNLDEDTQRFLDTGMFVDYGQSIGAVRTRLDAITRDPFTRATFAQPQNKLNLYELLKEPHVIVVNTNSKLLGKEGTALFGRFFLASLLRVVNRRQGGGFPCYVYADEAHQYIAQEEAVVDLINEARRQHISLTLAHHRMSDIKSPAVSSALQGAAIHIEPVHGKPRNWRVVVSNAEPVEVTPPNVNFEREPQMSRQDWNIILADMHRRFSVDPKQPDPPKQKINSVTPSPDDDATTHR